MGSPSLARAKMVAVVLLAGCLPWLIGLTAHGLVGHRPFIQVSLDAYVERTGTYMLPAASTAPPPVRQQGNPCDGSRGHSPGAET